MRKAGASAVIALVFAAIWGSAAGRAAPVATGDTCVAAGNGTAYTLNITIPSTAPQQFGFAFAARGAAVRNAFVPGSQGTFSTHLLPSGSSGAWITSSPLQPGSATASLTTNGQVKGSFSVMPASATTPTYFRRVTCAVSHGSSMPSSSFTVDRHATFVSARHVWLLTVTIPGAGVVQAANPVPSVGLGSVMKRTTMPLIESRKVGLKARAT